MKKIILFLIIGIFVTSCDDFTDLAPVSNRNEADFYNTANDFVVGINASYAELQDEGVYGRSYWLMFEMRGDNTDQGPDQTGIAKAFTDINSFSEDALNEQVEAAWVSSYRIIANCNTILSRINEVEIDATLSSRITGEALFLRSLMYYHLAVAYDRIPLQITLFVPGDVLDQVDASTVYSQLVTDLETAENNLEVSYSASDLGRATKGAAATLLAKVLLTMGNNSAAETVLRRIVSTYNYSLLDNYVDLWGAGNENNAESIFEVQFISGGPAQGSSFTNDFSPDGSFQTGQGFGRNRPTATMQNAYEATDTIRFEASMGTSWIDVIKSVVDPEVDSFVVVEQNFIRKYQSDPPTENDSDINFVVFRYADVLLMLAEAIGESDESYGLINEVRARAGLSSIDAATAGTFEEKLLHERQVELAFENHRWPDLRRFGVAAQMVSEAESIDEGSVKELFLIPQREIDINPNFTQN